MATCKDAVYMTVEWCRLVLLVLLFMRVCILNHCLSCIGIHLDCHIDNSLLYVTIHGVG